MARSLSAVRASSRALAQLSSLLSDAAPPRLLQHHNIKNLSSASSSSSSFLNSTPPQTQLFSKTLKSPCKTCSQSHHARCFCSSSPASQPNITLLKSEQDFNNSIKKAHDDKLPSIFYFTAAWCGPCKMISPVIEDLSRKYQHVNIFKIDVDQEELHKALSTLGISSVPTLHFFHDGKKATEMIGADVSRLKKTMEDLYK